MTSERPSAGPLALVPLVILLLALPASAGEIHGAIAGGDQKLVADLLARDPGLVTVTADNDTQDFPLHTAAIHGHVEIARLLLDAGAEVDAGDIDESTPLHVAALRRQSEMVDFLLERGADVNRRDKNGAYSLSFAAFSGDAAIVTRLIEAGADLNHLSGGGVTLLHAACFRGLEDLFGMMIEHGHGIEEASFNGSTPIHWAAAGGQPEMVQKLLEMGANPAQPDTSGQTPLFKAARSGNPEVARLLLEKGADPNLADAEGTCPILPAVWGGNAELVAALVEHGAEPTTRDETDRTPVWWAAQRGNAEIVEALLAAGADPNVAEKESGRTPLHNATIRGYGDVVERLLAKGAVLDAEDVSGSTPVHFARRYGHGAIARQLDTAGATRVETETVPGPASLGELSEGEALVWYLGHSGWAIQTPNHFLVFDYALGHRAADEAALVNGHIQPAELAGTNLTVFASHAHGDHFDPAVFGWREELEGVRYVLGFPPEEATHFDGEYPSHEFIGPREARTIDGMKISTIESNDSGVGFVVEADGVVIFHPGDHANRVRDTLEGYKSEIDALAARGVQPDICFQPVSGCGFGDLEAVRQGVEYTLRTLQPVLFFPMHGGTSEQRYRAFIDEHAERFPDVRMHAAEAPGDRVHYAGRKAS